MIDPTLSLIILCIASLALLAEVIKLCRRTHTEPSHELPEPQAWQYDNTRNAPERDSKGRMARSSWRV